MNSAVETVLQIDLDGLTEPCRPALVRFGRRGTGIAIVKQPGLTTVVDEASGLTLFPLDDMFTEQPVLIGFGTPNTYLVVPDGDNSTKKLAGFMFWRQRSAVVPTKGRVQAGVLFQLRGLPDSVVATIREQMQALSGRRSVSCAYLTGEVLAASGFTFGNGRSLKTFVRPSKFASLLWRHGLAYRDEAGLHPVSLRVVHATPKPFGDHFVGA